MSDESVDYLDRHPSVASGRSAASTGQPTTPGSDVESAIRVAGRGSLEEDSEVATTGATNVGLESPIRHLESTRRHVSFRTSGYGSADVAGMEEEFRPMSLDAARTELLALVSAGCPSSPGDGRRQSSGALTCDSHHAVGHRPSTVMTSTSAMEF